MPQTTAAGSAYVPLAPVGRIVDSRSGLGIATALGSGAEAAFPVLGKGGVPSSGVRAVLLSMGALTPTAATWFTVWPDGLARPTSRMVSAPAGQSLWNSTIVGVGSNGKVRVFNGSGTTDVVVDVQGYSSTSTPARSPAHRDPVGARPQRSN
jgi:hypothetical protein